MPFGGESSPFVLGCILEHRIETVSGNGNVKEQLKLNTYVDNVMGLIANEHQGKQFREEAVKIMEKLSTCHTNMLLGIMLQARKYVWYLMLVPSLHQKHFRLMNA